METNEKWRTLRARADALPGAQVERDIWSLSDDPRFPAVVALLADVRYGRLVQGSSVTTAGDHGTMAHCMGAVDAIDEVERRLQAMLEPMPLEQQVGKASP